MNTEKNIRKMKMCKKIIVSSVAILAVMVGAASIFIYNNRPHTLADVVPFESTEVKDISITYPAFYGLTGYTITDPEKIQEVVDHINTFEYSYIVGPWDLSGSSHWLKMHTYTYGEEYTLVFYANGSTVRIDDIWYVGEENEYFVELLNMPKEGTSESFLEGAAQRGKLKKV